MPTVTILTGDCREELAKLPAESVQMCVTSPPYWGLRDYGTSQWSGGDAECDHKPPNDAPNGNKGQPVIHAGRHKGDCRKCGAKRIDRQIGQEPSPEQFIETLVGVFREVRRVLHESGTVWLNVGDSYAVGKTGRADNSGADLERRAADYGSGTGEGRGPSDFKQRSCPDGLKPKDICLIPWRLALALQADGWWVRSVICWHKLSCMPESCSDRPTSSWEPIFLLAKSARYFYDGFALRNIDTEAVSGRNMRNVWSLGPEHFSGSHYAVFPTAIPRRAILAGTSARGCCPKCRAPWVRVVEDGEPFRIREGSDTSGASKQEAATGRHGDNSIFKTGCKVPTRTVGWEPGCFCNAGEPVPQTICDPFGGSGTSGMVALELGRNAVLIELSPDYTNLARTRCDVTPGLPLA